MSLIRGYLFLMALAFLGFALWCLGWTDQAHRFLGYEFALNDARVDFIAFYGGLELGIFLFLLAALRESRLVYAACLLSAFTMTGMALTRGAAIATNSDVGAGIWAAFIAEIVGAICGWLCVRQVLTLERSGRP